MEQEILSNFIKLKQKYYRKVARVLARPKKQGLDYFPLDVNIDNKIEIIESKYGILGFGFIIRMESV